MAAGDGGAADHHIAVSPSADEEHAMPPVRQRQARGLVGRAWLTKQRRKPGAHTLHHVVTATKIIKKPSQ